MKLPLEGKIPYALPALFVLAVFYGIYFAKMLAQKRRGRADPVTAFGTFTDCFFRGDYGIMIPEIRGDPSGKRRQTP